MKFFCFLCIVQSQQHKPYNCTPNYSFYANAVSILHSVHIIFLHYVAVDFPIPSFPLPFVKGVRAMSLFIFMKKRLKGKKISKEK